MFANSQMTGISPAFADICLTPVGPRCYPNTSMEMMGVPVGYTILYGGTLTHSSLTQVPITNGNSSGILLSAASHLMTSPTKFITSAFTYLTFGAPAIRLTSMTIHNMIDARGQLGGQSSQTPGTGAVSGTPRSRPADSDE